MKVAIIGTGKIVGEALYAIQHVEGMDVVAICSRPQSVSKAEALAKDYYINKVYTDYELLLNDDDVEFVYIGIVNSAHYEYGRKALMANKNVIMEKPFTATLSEAEELQKIALERRLYIFEGVTLFSMRNFARIGDEIKKIAPVRMVQSNYSQYSSRYDRYLNGEIAPAFDPQMAGGALNDINVYNINLVVGLFGEPKDVVYYATIGPNGIDTSGICLLKYEDFVASCAGAKDSASPGFTLIQGEKGWIKVNGIPSIINYVESFYNGESHQLVEESYPHRMVPELKSFVEIYNSDDYELMKSKLSISLSVMRTLEKAHQTCGCDE